MKTIILFLLFILVNNIFGSYVKKIIIEGNDKTQTSIILDNISHSINSSFDLYIAKKDKEQLYALECFDDVSIEYVDSTYYVSLTEMALVTWQPRFKDTDGIGWSGGVQVNFNNINGKTNRMHTELMLGAVSRYRFEWVDRKFGKLNNQLKIKFYNQKNSDVESTYKILNQTVIIDFSFKKNNLNFLLKGKKNNISGNILYNDTFKYLIPSITFNKYFMYKNFNQFFQIIYEYNHSLNKEHEHYEKIAFNINNLIPLMKIDRPPSLELNFKCKGYSKSTLPIYEYNFLGGDNYVRGYDVNPISNVKKSHDKLKFYNIIVSTIQLNIPIIFESKIMHTLRKQKMLYNTNLFIYLDTGYGNDNYKNFNFSNKITGFGLGLSYDAFNFGRSNIAIGINEFGGRKIHFSINDIIF